MKPYLGIPPSAHLQYFRVFLFVFYFRFSPVFLYCLSFLSVPFFPFILVSDFYVRGLSQMSGDVCCLFISKNKALQRD